MTVSFELSDDLVGYGREIRDWSVEAVRPYARYADVHHAAPDHWRQIVETCPVAIGTHDRRQVKRQPAFAEGKWVRDLVAESLTYGDHWISNVIGAGIGHLVVKLMGTPEQIDKWYRPIVDNGGQTAFGLTEPQFGSDTSMVETTATRDGDTWVLNGTKMYCTYGGQADYVVVFASTDSSAFAAGPHPSCSSRTVPSRWRTSLVGREATVMALARRLAPAAAGAGRSALWRKISPTSRRPVSLWPKPRWTSRPTCSKSNDRASRPTAGASSSPTSKT